MKKIYFSFTFFATYIIFLVSCGDVDKKRGKYSEKDFDDFLISYEKEIIPLNKEIQETNFLANVSGKDAHYKKSAKLGIKITKLYSDKKKFEMLKSLKESNILKDTLKKRQLEVLYNEYYFHQVDRNSMASMVTGMKELEKKFSVYRTVLDKKKLSSNEIEKILSNTKNSEKLEKVWKASKKVGEEVAENLIKLVKMRNKAARSLNFKNYFEMRLILSEQNPEEIETIYEELDLLTGRPYAELKYDMDDYFSEYYNIPVKALRPWHYQNRFFQEAPNIYKVDFDKYFHKKDIVNLSEIFFESIKLEIDDIISNSDLFEEEGKTEMAFTRDINRNGDVRILANIRDNSSSMRTMLYESAFAIYLKNIDKNLPYTLKEPAHFLINDAVAVLFSRMATSPSWLKNILNIDEKEINKISKECFKKLRLEKFVFSRFAQVMYHFEKDLYANPDRDLNKHWWDLVEKYQLIKRPDNRNLPDWASKIHLITQPCQYHNYMLGELLASQFENYLRKNRIVKDKNFVGNTKVGEYFQNHIFRYGNFYQWNELIERATGEKLSADHFKNQFIGIK